MRPIYIVSGWMRSGTTMMMKALQAGGMTCVYTPGNPHLELDQAQYKLGLRPQNYEGMVVKSLRAGPERMRPWPGGYKVVFMQRDSREQQASWFKENNQLYTLEVIEGQVELCLELVQNRKDAELLEIRYSDVINSPAEELQKVADFFGEQFDIVKAAAQVDPTMKHFSIEEMAGVEIIEPEEAQRLRDEGKVRILANG